MVETCLKRMIPFFIGFFIFSTCNSSYILAWPWDKPKAKMEEKKIPQAQPAAEEFFVNEAETSDQEYEPAFDEATQSDPELKEPARLKRTEETQAEVVQPIQTSVQPVKIYRQPFKIVRSVQRIQPAFQLPFRPITVIRPTAENAGSATPTKDRVLSKEKKIKGEATKNQKEE